MGRAVLAEMSRVSGAISYSAESEAIESRRLNPCLAGAVLRRLARDRRAFLVEVMSRNCGLTERVLYFSWKLFAMKSI